MTSCTGFAMPAELKLCWNVYAPTCTTGQAPTKHAPDIHQILESSDDQGGAKQVSAVLAQAARQA